MLLAKINSKGQITIPPEIRETTGAARWQRRALHSVAEREIRLRAAADPVLEELEGML